VTGVKKVEKIIKRWKHKTGNHVADKLKDSAAQALTDASRETQRTEARIDQEMKSIKDEKSPECGEKCAIKTSK